MDLEWGRDFHMSMVVFLTMKAMLSLQCHILFELADYDTWAWHLLTGIGVNCTPR